MGFKQKNLTRLINETKNLKYTCKKGCYECCTGITFLDIEEKAMKKELLKNGYKTPPQGKGKEYCEYLDKEGRCTVYNARPMVCRQFGNISFEMKVGKQSIKTPVCTYTKTALIIPASELFMKYGNESLNKGILNKCGEKLLKNIKKKGLLNN